MVFFFFFERNFGLNSLSRFALWLIFGNFWPCEKVFEFLFHFLRVPKANTSKNRQNSYF